MKYESKTDGEIPAFCLVYHQHEYKEFKLNKSLTQRSSMHNCKNAYSREHLIPGKVNAGNPG